MSSEKDVAYIPPSKRTVGFTLLFINITERDTARFWAKVNVAGEEECWNWKGVIRQANKPYGRFVLGGKIVSAHRVSYKINFGVDPFELHVLHSCDNPRCVNPKHLFLGTNADNIKDKVSKNRQARGKAWNKGKSIDSIKFWNNPSSVASEEDYKKMKLEYENGGGSLDSISKKYGASKRALAKYIRSMGGHVSTHFSILTPQTVVKIRNEFAVGGVNHTQLANKFKIGKKTISDIIHKRTWVNIK